MQKTKPTTAYFELGDLMGIVMTFVVVGIGLVYGLSIQEDTKNDMDRWVCNDDNGYSSNQSATSATGACYPTNLSAWSNFSIDSTGNTPEWTGGGNAIAATAKFSTKLGLISTVCVAAIVIGVLVRYLWVGNK